MKRSERIEGLLARDRELMAQLKSATDEETPDLLRQRKQVKSQMNLYGPAAVKRLLRQDFAEFTDLVIEQEEERRARRAKRGIAEKVSAVGVSADNNSDEWRSQ